MKWEAGDRSNIEDGRGRSGGPRVAGLGIGGVLILLVLSWVSGTNLFSLIGTDVPGDVASGPASPAETTPAEERVVDMVDAVMNDAQDTWSQLLGSRYQRTKVFLFREAVQSACGAAESATGPFYCPADSKVYLDLSFFNELSQRFGAPGEFAEAYVVAHELGHHVQNLLGLSERASQDRRPGPQSASVAVELQADCFAGIWGHAASRDRQLHAGQVRLEPGDAEEALRAAAAIGDDRLQKMATGRVMPERFTHGTSAQRVEAFSRGMQSGDPRACMGTTRATY
jgi:predicted metalloprotease